MRGACIDSTRRTDLGNTVEALLREREVLLRILVVLIVEENATKAAGLMGVVRWCGGGWSVRLVPGLLGVNSVDSVNSVNSVNSVAGWKAYLILIDPSVYRTISTY